MKNIYFFLLILTLFSCDTTSFIKTNSISTICPNILFASEHKTYLGSSSDTITLDNVNFQAEINNAEFLKGCQIVDNIFSSDLSALFIITPLDENLGMIIDFLTSPILIVIPSTKHTVKCSIWNPFCSNRRPFMGARCHMDLAGGPSDPFQ